MEFSLAKEQHCDARQKKNNSTQTSNCKELERRERSDELQQQEQEQEQEQQLNKNRREKKNRQEQEGEEEGEEEDANRDDDSSCGAFDSEKTNDDEAFSGPEYSELNHFNFFHSEAPSASANANVSVSASTNASISASTNASASTSAMKNHAIYSCGVDMGMGKPRSRARSRSAQDNFVGEHQQKVRTKLVDIIRKGDKGKRNQQRFPEGEFRIRKNRDDTYKQEQYRYCENSDPSDNFPSKEQHPSESSKEIGKGKKNRFEAESNSQWFSSHTPVDREPPLLPSATTTAGKEITGKEIAGNSSYSHEPTGQDQDLLKGAENTNTQLEQRNNLEDASSSMGDIERHSNAEGECSFPHERAIFGDEEKFAAAYALGFGYDGNIGAISWKANPEEDPTLGVPLSGVHRIQSSSNSFSHSISDTSISTTTAVATPVADSFPSSASSSGSNISQRSISTTTFHYRAPSFSSASSGLTSSFSSSLSSSSSSSTSSSSSSSSSTFSSSSPSVPATTCGCYSSSSSPSMPSTSTTTSQKHSKRRHAPVPKEYRSTSGMLTSAFFSSFTHSPTSGSNAFDAPTCTFASVSTSNLPTDEPSSCFGQNLCNPKPDNIPQVGNFSSQDVHANQLQRSRKQVRVSGPSGISCYGYNPEIAHPPPNHHHHHHHDDHPYHQTFDMVQDNGFPFSEMRMHPALANCNVTAKNKSDTEISWKSDNESAVPTAQCLHDSSINSNSYNVVIPEANWVLEPNILVHCFCSKDATALWSKVRHCVSSSVICNQEGRYIEEIDPCTWKLYRTEGETKLHLCSIKLRSLVNREGPSRYAIEIQVVNRSHGDNVGEKLARCIRDNLSQHGMLMPEMKSSNSSFSIIPNYFLPQGINNDTAAAAPSARTSDRSHRQSQWLLNANRQREECHYNRHHPSHHGTQTSDGPTRENNHDNGDMYYSCKYHGNRDLENCLDPMVYSADCCFEFPADDDDDIDEDDNPSPPSGYGYPSDSHQLYHAMLHRPTVLGTSSFHDPYPRPEEVKLCEDAEMDFKDYVRRQSSYSTSATSSLPGYLDEYQFTGEENEGEGEDGNDNGNAVTAYDDIGVSLREKNDERNNSKGGGGTHGHGNYNDIDNDNDNDNNNMEAEPSDHFSEALSEMLYCDQVDVQEQAKRVKTICVD